MTDFYLGSIRVYRPLPFFPFIPTLYCTRDQIFVHSQSPLKLIHSPEICSEIRIHPGKQTHTQMNKLTAFCVHVSSGVVHEAFVPFRAAKGVRL